MVDIKDIFRIAGQAKGDTRKINHLAVTVDGTYIYASKKKERLEEVFLKTYANLQRVISQCIEKNIPILTFYLLPEYSEDEPNFSKSIDWIADIFGRFCRWDFINSNQVKISVFGKWYNLPGRAVEPIKEAIGCTKDYDRFFLNFCINYSGQEEIVDACRIIVKQVTAGKLNPDMISKETLKENLYTSYFIPPELIIKTGKAKKLKGFLLWDSVDSRIYFADKYWPEFSKSDFQNALDFYNA